MRNRLVVTVTPENISYIKNSDENIEVIQEVIYLSEITQESLMSSHVHSLYSNISKK